MGADVHVVLGRINFKAIADRRDTPASESTTIALFGQANIQSEDFSLMDVPDEYDLYRNYALFSWLAGVRGDLRPLDLGGTRKELTDQFLNWLDRKWSEAEKAGDYEPSYGFGRWCGHDGIHDRYDTGEHSRIIHTVNTLRNFNYDQVAEVRNYDSPEDSWDNPVYVKPLQGGETYREHFGDQYFKFLDFCVQDNWHFVLFGFDN